VISAEFRGREFFAFGRADNDSPLAFRSDTRLDVGSVVHLNADRERVLVFKGTSS
jgi:hypothetical protein